MRRGGHPAIADRIVGHGNRKKYVQSRHLNISDANLVAAIDAMEFDGGDAEIWVERKELEQSRFHR